MLSDKTGLIHSTTNGFLHRDAILENSDLFDEFWWILFPTPWRIRIRSHLTITMCFYRPQRSCGKELFSQTCIKNSVLGGHVWQGACVAGGYAWQGGHAWGACVAGETAIAVGGHAWQGGMRGRGRGSCVAGGGGHAWQGEGVMRGGRGIRDRRSAHCSGRYAFYWNGFLFFLLSCANSYTDDNATHLWWHAYHVKNQCRCYQVSTGPYWCTLMNCDSFCTMTRF